MSLTLCRRCGLPLASNPRPPGGVPVCPRCGELDTTPAEITTADRLRNPTCAVCHAALTSRQAVARGLCDDPECHRRYLLEVTSAPNREKAEARRRKRERLKLQLARFFAPEEPEDLAVALLPSNDWRIGNLPERRRRAFRDHLMRLISQAVQPADATSPTGTARGPSGAPGANPTADEPPAPALACATCGGRCCQTGREHAFQTTEDIRRYIAAHPGQRPRHILESYLSRLPTRSYRDSCVYHAEAGCLLPREMRSATCNDFQCEDITELHEDLSGGKLRRGIAVAMCDDEIVRTAFIGEAELACAPRPRRAGGAPVAGAASARKPTRAESRDRGAGGAPDAQRGDRRALRI